MSRAYRKLRVDWTDPRAVRAYHSNYMRRLRRETPYGAIEQERKQGAVLPKKRWEGLLLAAMKQARRAHVQRPRDPVLHGWRPGRGRLMAED